MRKNRLFLLMIVPLLTGCKPSVLQFVPYTNYMEPRNLNIDLDEEHYYAREIPNSTHTNKGDYNNFYDFSLMGTDGRNHKLLKSKGEAKILVIPIAFKDSPNDISREDKTIYIKNAFFGDEITTTGQSVASFYNKSSYGNLKISGEVASWVDIDMNIANWKTSYSGHTDASRKLTLQALKYLKDNNLIDVNEFDNDEDGYIDAIYTIYDYNYSSNSSDSGSNLLWAYTDFIKENEAGLNNVTPYANAYSWSSLYFAYKGNNKVDASTYIHEVGHLFGLDDYYNTGPKGSVYHFQPTGFFDLMDSNQGDHTAFSKYIFNWTSPKVIKRNSGDFTLKLNNFSTTGDYLLLPLDDNYGDNPFGEYLLLEYFCPEGLNKSNNIKYVDYDINGKQVTFSFPNVHGLKVYHVDARLAYFKKGTLPAYNAKAICMVGEEESHASELADPNTYLVDFAFSNEIKDSEVGSRNPLYHLLESSGNNTFKDGKLADNNTLFRYGSTFGKITFTDLSKRCGYSFEITNISTKNATIKFTEYKEN